MRIDGRKVGRLDFYRSNAMKGEKVGSIFVYLSFSGYTYHQLCILALGEGLELVFRPCLSRDVMPLPWPRPYYVSKINLALIREIVLQNSPAAELPLRERKKEYRREDDPHPVLTPARSLLGQ